jgi:hypothetical protein
MLPAITGPMNKPKKYDVLQQMSVEASTVDPQQTHK